MKNKPIYKVIFHNQGKIYEIHAQEVAQSGMLGFIEISGLLFGERSTVVVDPTEERLKAEFDGVKRAYVPMHSIVRIDEVEKQGINKILPRADGDSNVAQFPLLTSGKDKS